MQRHGRDAEAAGTEWEGGPLLPEPGGPAVQSCPCWRGAAGKPALPLEEKAELLAQINLKLALRTG